jgi:hypothetical protein
VGRARHLWPNIGNDGVAVLNDDMTVVRRSDVLWRTAPGYLVLATLDGGVHEAAGPAPEIWRAIDRPIEIGRLIASLAERYALAHEQIRDDVISFLYELVRAGLVSAGAQADG